MSRPLPLPDPVAWPYVCTACGQRFPSRGAPGVEPVPADSLEAHWRDTPECHAALHNPVGTWGPPPFRSQP